MKHVLCFGYGFYSCSREQDAASSCRQLAVANRLHVPCMILSSFQFNPHTNKSILPLSLLQLGVRLQAKAAAEDKTPI